MKRRTFFGVPLALAGLGMVPAAHAAVGFKGGALALDALLLRLDDSDDWPTDLPPTGRRWLADFASSAGNAARARVTLHGLVRTPTSSLGALDVEALYFGADGGVNTALVYISAPGMGGARSKSIGFDAEARAFAGLQVSPRGIARTASGCLCSLGDNATGCLRPGLYVLVLGTGKLPDPAGLAFSGDLQRPLVGIDGRAPAFDYLTFSIVAAA